MLGVGMALLGLGGTDNRAGRQVIITSLQSEDLVVDLSRARTIEVKGPLGTTRIVVEEGGARITESPCPHKLCIKRGRVSRVGDLVACLPNGVVMTVTGESDYDGITP
jgi:hypothetical protein